MAKPKTKKTPRLKRRGALSAKIAFKEAGNWEGGPLSLDDALTFPESFEGGAFELSWGEGKNSEVLKISPEMASELLNLSKEETHGAIRAYCFLKTALKRWVRANPFKGFGAQEKKECAELARALALEGPESADAKGNTLLGTALKLLPKKEKEQAIRMLGVAQKEGIIKLLLENEDSEEMNVLAVAAMNNQETEFILLRDLWEESGHGMEGAIGEEFGADGQTALELVLQNENPSFAIMDAIYESEGMWPLARANSGDGEKPLERAKDHGHKTFCFMAEALISGRWGNWAENCDAPNESSLALLSPLGADVGLALSGALNGMVLKMEGAKKEGVGKEFQKTMQWLGSARIVEGARLGGWLGAGMALALMQGILDESVLSKRKGYFKAIADFASEKAWRKGLGNIADPKTRSALEKAMKNLRVREALSDRRLLIGFYLAQAPGGDEARKKIMAREADAFMEFCDLKDEDWLRPLSKETRSLIGCFASNGEKAFHFKEAKNLLEMGCFEDEDGQMFRVWLMEQLSGRDGLQEPLLKALGPNAPEELRAKIEAKVLARATREGAQSPEKLRL